MDEWPPELLHRVAYSGYLTQQDVLSLCCASQTVSVKLVGDDYGKNYFKSLMGARACAQYKWWDAARYALLNGDKFTNGIVYLLFHTSNTWTPETQRMIDYLLKKHNIRATTDNLTVAAGWDSEPFKKLCLNQDFENIDGSHIAAAVKTRDNDFFRTFVRRMPSMKHELAVETFGYAIEAICETKQNEMLDVVYQEFSKFDLDVDEYFFNDIICFDGVQVFKHAMTKFPKHCGFQLLWNAIASFTNPVFLSSVLTWPGITDDLVRDAIKRLSSEPATELLPVEQIHRLLKCPALDVCTPIDVSELQNVSKHLLVALEAFPFICPRKRKHEDSESDSSKKQKLLL
ncbi:MAG: hypothetical protein CMP20_02835 [Rickettsiales bacterium]|nr:hypothetical protein [Rickettsiales bacterium]